MLNAEQLGRIQQILLKANFNTTGEGSFHITGAIQDIANELKLAQAIEATKPKKEEPKEVKPEEKKEEKKKA